MKDWMLRVIAEQEELDAKIMKLQTFLDAEPGIEDKVIQLLHKQLGIMKDYSQVLSERIQWFDMVIKLEGSGIG